MNVCSLFHNYLPFKNGEALRLKQNESPSPKNALCKVCMKLAQWICRRFLKFVNVFLQFRNYIPLEKCRHLHVHKFEFQSPKDNLLKLAQWFWRRSFLKFMTEFSLFHNYLPLEKVLACHLNKL